MSVKKIAIVSLSRGILGEPFVSHELKIGLKRLEEYGLEVEMMPHALKGLNYIEKHPEKRAEDLLAALKDDSIDMIFSAIGGEETYRLLPYLFDHDELKDAVKKKIFLGYSDTTWNHFMLRKVGLNTFYGQAFLSDLCELSPSMLSYSRHYFEELIQTGRISKITPSDIWYSSRDDFSEKAVGTLMEAHENEGFVLLQGSPVFEGEIFGGCIESIYDMFDGTRFADTALMAEKYELFPSLDEWKGKILLLESSEEKPSPQLYRKMVETLKKTGIFEVISGVLLGKNPDETDQREHYEIFKEVVDKKDLPIVGNLNVGHAMPRCIVPFGVYGRVDVTRQEITF